MQSLTSDEIKRVSLEILVSIDAFCMQNNIKYSLFSGTLLGCIRHEGFIPWDDDIDIAMPREDYERFIATFQGRHLRVISCYSDRNYYLPWAKVIDLRTVKVEKTRGKKNSELGVDVDVYPCDYIEEERQAVRLKRIIEPFRIARGYALRPFNQRTPIHNFLSIFFSGCANYCCRRIDRIGQKYNHAGTRRFIFRNCIFSNASDVYPLGIFDDLQRKLFEKRFFNVSAKFDTILKSRYGKYMILPDAKDRVSHHYYSVYWRDKPVSDS